MVKIPDKNSMVQEEQYGTCKNREFPTCPKSPTCPTGANGAKAAKEGCLSTETGQEEAQHLEKWYDNYEVMEMFHISQRTLQTLRSNGKLPFAKLGNKCFYREQDLQQMMMESFRDSRVKFSDHDTPDDNKEGGGAWQ